MPSRSVMVALIIGIFICSDGEGGGLGKGVGKYLKPKSGGVRGFVRVTSA